MPLLELGYTLCALGGGMLAVNAGLVTLTWRDYRKSSRLSKEAAEMWAQAKADVDRARVEIEAGRAAPTIATEPICIPGAAPDQMISVTYRAGNDGLWYPVGCMNDRVEGMRCQ